MLVLSFVVGWAAAIRYDECVRRQFDEFRRRTDTFSLGVCNGCQLMALLGWVGTTEDTLGMSERVLVSQFVCDFYVRQWKVASTTVKQVASRQFICMLIKHCFVVDSCECEVETFCECAKDPAIDKSSRWLPVLKLICWNCETRVFL